MLHDRKAGRATFELICLGGSTKTVVISVQVIKKYGLDEAVLSLQTLVLALPER